MGRGEDAFLLAREEAVELVFIAATNACLLPFLSPILQGLYLVEKNDIQCVNPKNKKRRGENIFEACNGLPETPVAYLCEGVPDERERLTMCCTNNWSPDSMNLPDGHGRCQKIPPTETEDIASA